MKILTLSKIQQSHLLILCKEFFPGILAYINNEQMVELWKKSSVKEAAENNISKDDLIFGDCDICIHWYQLCLTELPKRIWLKIDWKGIEDLNDYWFGEDRLIYKFETWLFEEYNLDKEDSCSDFQEKVFFSKHPVDFLWKFVQDCKKYKYFKNETKRNNTTKNKE